jgi:hypothetical protein
MSPGAAKAAALMHVRQLVLQSIVEKQSSRIFRPTVLA